MIRRGYRSVAAVPIRADDAVYGALAVYADRPKAFTASGPTALADLSDAVADAIEAVETNRELERSERTYRQLFDEANEAMFVHDAGTGQIVAVNQRVCDLLRTTREEILHSGVGDFSVGRHPYTEDRAVDLIHRTARGEPRTFEWRARDYAGREFWMEVNLKRTDIGGEEHVLAVVRDVTERKRRESMLYSLHESTRRLVHTETERGIYEVAIEAAEDVLDPAMAVGLSFDEEAGVLRPVETTRPMRAPFDEPRTALSMDVPGTLVGRAFESGEVTVFDDVGDEATAPFDDATIGSLAVLPLERHGVVLVGTGEANAFDEVDRHFADALAANAEAALDRAARERLLRGREAELVQERDRFAALFQNVPDPALRCTFVDERPIVQSVNAAFERVFGFEAETVVGNCIDEFVVPPERADEAAEFNRCLQRGERVRTEVTRETADGTREFFLQVVPFTVGERSVHGYAIYTDITDLKRRERRLTEENRWLEEFTNMVSHDLRNPLNVATGYLELARETGDPEHFAKVESTHERMDRLVEDLLRLAREGRMVGETDAVALESCSRRAWESVETHDAKLRCRSPGSVEADLDRLVELLENLFHNAIRHGGSDATVTVGAFEGGFYVVDDGAGIDGADRDRMFESGYTSDVDGTGFGLAIVKNIVDEHGWEIAVTEAEGGGARFDVLVGPDRT